MHGFRLEFYKKPPMNISTIISYISSGSNRMHQPNVHVTKRFGTSKFPNIEPCRACEPGVKTAPAHADSQSSSGTREPSKQFVLCDSLSFWLNSSLDIGPHVLHHFNVDSDPLPTSCRPAPHWEEHSLSSRRKG